MVLPCMSALVIQAEAPVYLPRARRVSLVSYSKLQDGDSLGLNLLFWDIWALMWNDYEAQNGYNASEFKIEMYNQDNHVVTPAEFMQGSVKRMVEMIHNIEPDTYCILYATVHNIQYESGWAYTGCKACKTKVTAIASKGASGSRNKKQLWHCKKH
ncbi:hypothetical protein Tco_1143493 [Tanacetum coccineum]